MGKKGVAESVKATELRLTASCDNQSELSKTFVRQPGQNVTRPGAAESTAADELTFVLLS